MRKFLLLAFSTALCLFILYVFLSKEGFNFSFLSPLEQESTVSTFTKLEDDLKILEKFPEDLANSLNQGQVDRKTFKKALAIYPRISDEVERLEAARAITIHLLSLYKLSAATGEKTHSKDSLSVSEEEVVKNAESYLRWADSLVSQFERSIPVDERVKAADGLPYSLLPLNKVYFSNPDKVCKDSDLKEIRLEGLKDQEEKRKFTRLYIFVSSREEHYAIKYIEYYKKYLAKSAHKYKRVLEHQFDDLLSKLQNHPHGNKENLKMYNIGVKDLDRYSYQTALQAPHCFMSPYGENHFDILKRYRALKGYGK